MQTTLVVEQSQIGISGVQKLVIFSRINDISIINQSSFYKLIFGKNYFYYQRLIK